MKGKNRLVRAAVPMVMVCLTMCAAEIARAETISAGISSTINNSTSGAYTAGVIDSFYVTAVFGTNAYIQDSTGGIYLYKGANATYGVPGIAIGTQITMLGSNSTGGFQYYTTGTQFEYEPATSTTTYGYGMLTAGTYQSIPASYYTTMALPTFNSTAAQGNSTNEGMQNQLVTIGSVTITPTGTASASTFTSGGTYTMTDISGNTGVFYVNASSGIVSQPVPTGSVNVSGVFQDYKGTSELIPRGTYDLTAVPEPASTVLLGGGLTGLMLLAVRRNQRARCLNAATQS